MSVNPPTFHWPYLLINSEENGVPIAPRWPATATMLSVPKRAGAVLLPHFAIWPVHMVSVLFICLCLLIRALLGCAAATCPVCVSVSWQGYLCVNRCVLACRHIACHLCGALTEWP